MFLNVLNVYIKMYADRFGLNPLDTDMQFLELSSNYTQQKKKHWSHLSLRDM